jgi:ATP-dependent Clp protease, protease subunit
MQAPPLPPVVYATFSGQINQDGLTRIFHSIGGASQRGTTEIHLLFESGGGIVGDGIALYNYFRALPLDLHIYNSGTVGSIAVLSFLGAGKRYVSQHATFVIHKTVYPTHTPTNAVGHQALAANLLVEDARSEAILRAHTNIPAARWFTHATADVIFQAPEAVQFGIANAIREFQIPAGNQVFNI